MGEGFTYQVFACHKSAFSVNNFIYLFVYLVDLSCTGAYFIMFPRMLGRICEKAKCSPRMLL